MEKLSKNFSLLITGQILSRLRVGDYEDFISWLEESKENFGEIVISTWADEVNQEIRNLVDTVITNDDPGPDKFKTLQNPENKGRQLVQNLSGLSACNREVVFRARVEFFKMNQQIVNETNSTLITNFLKSSPIKLISPAPGSLSAQLNGCPFFLSDTFIIASKESLINWYRQMLQDFKSYEFWWYRPKLIFESLAFEQIFGLAMVQELSGKRLRKAEMRKLNRVFISRRTFRIMKKCFNQQILLFNPNILGISGGRWLNYNQDYVERPNYLKLELSNYILFRIRGLKYTFRKYLRVRFQKYLKI